MAHERERYSELRILAARYARGEIPRQEYKRLRADLVRKLVGGEVPLVYLMPEKPQATKPEVEDEIFDLGEVTEGGAGVPRMMPLALGGVALLFVLLIAAWWVMGVPGEQPGEPAMVFTPVEQPEMQAGEGLLYAFLQENDWTEDALGQLASDWSALDEDSRQGARGTVSWRRLQSSLRSRINEQQALSAYDESGEAAALEEKLRALQEHLSRD